MGQDRPDSGAPLRWQHAHPGFRGSPTHEAPDSRMSTERPSELRERARALVATWPPLTPEQRARLAAALRRTATETRSTAA